MVYGVFSKWANKASKLNNAALKFGYVKVSFFQNTMDTSHGMNFSIVYNETTIIQTLDMTTLIKTIYSTARSSFHYTWINVNALHK